MSNSQLVSNNQYNPLVQLTGDEDFKQRAIAFLQQQFADFCRMNNTHSEITFLADNFDELVDIDFDEINNPDNI